MPNSSTAPLHDLPRQLAGGLLLRQATPADIDAAAEFAASMHGDPALGVSARDLMSGDHPTTAASDFVLVTNPTARQRIVAMAGLISQTWAYDGLPFGVGLPELVATDPAYRRRGLMRAVMEGIHCVSAARGHLASAIQGLRWFYRQFGYEYALNPGPRRDLPLSDLPTLPQDQPEPYTVRRMVAADIPLIAPLYRQQCAGQAITNVLDEAIRRHDISGYSPGSDLGDWTSVVVDSAGRFVAYFSTWGDPWGAFTIKELASIPGVPLADLLPTILRFTGSLRDPYADTFGDEPPEAIRLALSGDHPAHALLNDRLGPLLPRQDFYIRVPDLPRFLQHIAPILEQRLAASVLRELVGDLRLTFFRGGLRLAFDQGCLRVAAHWEPPDVDEPRHTASFPPLVFLKLLFGYRSLAELRYAYPDCWADERDTRLLETLFPKQPSWLRQL